MSRRAFLIGGTAFLMAGTTGGPALGQSPAAAARPRARLNLSLVPVTADFDELMRTTRNFRIAAPASPTLCLVDKGTLYGSVPEGALIAEQWVNRTYRTGRRPATFFVGPMTRARLLPTLAENRAEIAAGNLTVTPERLALVLFTNPVLRGVNEVVVTRDTVPELDSPEALSGRVVVTKRVSSYHASLLALNERLGVAGKPPITIRLVPDELETEDLMEMVSADLIPAVIADDWMAKFWVPIYGKLRLHPKAAVRTGTDIAWAVRKTAPQLAEVLNKLIDQRNLNGGRQVAADVAGIMAKLKRLHSATAQADTRRFRATIDMFRKYAGQYGFDHLMLVAQSYQESRLNQNARSHVGAIGMMQLMPATGREMRVGDIQQTEANVHAGAKYMRQMLDVYFADAEFNEQNRNLFAFAAYNAGPGRMRQMRDLAKQRGLDPNVWFENVELVTAERVGQEPVKYVRNIFKYYAAYKLVEEAEAASDTARQAIAPRATQ
ncbi:MAG: transporter substrate-binding domain-containing protein [Acetobacteraceae bacterium]|nr:transporter substrate-binding domain-containing protein [Acetobacteraceae bacterium]